MTDNELTNIMATVQAKSEHNALLAAQIAVDNALLEVKQATYSSSSRDLLDSLRKLVAVTIQFDAKELLAKTDKMADEVAKQHSAMIDKVLDSAETYTGRKSQLVK